MSPATFTLVFLFVWLCTLAYVLSVVRMALRVRQLKREGRAQDAPGILFMPFEGIRGIAWLLTGRYSELGDDVVTRWSRIARLLFFLVLPMILALFVVAATMLRSP
jgi:hypothetical protein